MEVKFLWSVNSIIDRCTVYEKHAGNHANVWRHVKALHLLSVFIADLYKLSSHSAISYVLAAVRASSLWVANNWKRFSRIWSYLKYCRRQTFGSYGPSIQASCAFNVMSHCCHMTGFMRAESAADWQTCIHRRGWKFFAQVVWFVNSVYASRALGRRL